MTHQQMLSFAIVAGMMALFVWGRLRYDLVAVLSLLVAVLVGIVPADKAFEGFSDDIVIIVASALLVSAAVAKSGILEAGLNRVGPYLRTTQIQIVVLVTVVTVLSAFVKNIGALAMMIPVAFQIARRTNTPPSATPSAVTIRPPMMASAATILLLRGGRASARRGRPCARLRPSRPAR